MGRGYFSLKHNPFLTITAKKVGSSTNIKNTENIYGIIWGEEKRIGNKSKNHISRFK
jgi:hypothetical protein